MTEVSSILKQTQNLPNTEKLSALNRQADQLLKGLKTSILKGLDVADKGYNDRLVALQDELGDFKSRTGSRSVYIMRDSILKTFSPKQFFENSLTNVVHLRNSLIASLNSTELG